MSETNINAKKVSPVRLLFMAAAGVYLDGYQLSVIALAVLLMVPDLHLTTFQESLVIGAVILGTIIGTIFVGYLSDLFGRRRIYIYNLAFFLLFGLISILTSNFLVIIISRVLMGIAVGADYPVSNSYIAEIAPKEVRGKYLSFSNVAFVLGSVSSILVALLFFAINLPADWGWRFMIGIGLIPAAIVLYMRLSMPESYRWENVKGKVVGTKIIKDMFTGLGGKFTILTAVIWFLYDMVIYGISLFTPTILKMIYGPNVPNFENALFSSIFLVALLGSSLLVMFIVDQTGRKILQILGFAGLGIFLVMIPIAYNSLISLVMFLVILEFFNGFPGTTVGMFPAELSKTEFRASAYGFASMMGKIGALAGVIILGSTIGPSSLNIFVIFGVIMFIAAILSLFLVDTTNMDLDELYKFKEKLSEEE
ncbi:MAG: MFS transporter [Thermoplasmata archaeon]